MDSLPSPPSPSGAPPRILIWLQDPVEADLLAIQLRQAGLVVVAARSGEHVRNALAWAPADAFIVEIPTSRAADTLAFIKAQRSKNTALYAVAPSGGVDRATELKLLSIGCRQLWSMPLSAVAIAQQIWSAPPGATPLAKDSAELRGVSGDFRYQPLTYVIQVCRRHRVSARLHARLASGEGDDWGVILMRGGEVIDAETPGLRGKAAAVEWLGRAEHHFVLHPLSDTAPDLQRPDVIQEDVARLLMRAQHRSDMPTPALAGPQVVGPATGVADRAPVSGAPTPVEAPSEASATAIRQEARTPRETTAPQVAAPGPNPNTRRGARPEGADQPTSEPRRATDRMGPTTAPQPRPLADVAQREMTEASLIPAESSPQHGKGRISTAEGVPRVPAETLEPPKVLEEYRSVAHVKRLRRVDAAPEQGEETEHSDPAGLRSTPRRSTSPRGHIRATRGGLFVATSSREEGESGSTGRSRIGTRRGRIAMIAHDDDDRSVATAESADVNAKAHNNRGRGSPAISFFEHPRLENAPSGAETKIQKDDPTDPPHEAVRADPAGFYVNPKSGLIHLSSLNRPTEPTPPPQPANGGAPRVNLHHSQLQPTRRRHPTSSGLRAEQQAVFEEKLAGVGTEDGFEPPRRRGHLAGIAGWTALALTVVILVIVGLSSSGEAPETVVKASGSESPTAIIESLRPGFLSNTLKAPELKILASAMLQVDAPAGEVRPVVQAAARQSPGDLDITTWLAVLALADGDLDDFRTLRAQAEMLAPSSPEVQRLQALAP